MAAPANKSSTPLSSSSSSPSIASRQNPRPRNSEAGDPMRRSFGGNPFPNNKPTVLANLRGLHSPGPTPANSPSDFTWRNLIGRESARREFEDKENEKDQNSNRGRASLTPKGSKNFMSPTISAASKVNASPRKKVLAEKNEGIRNSVSFSDVRSLIMEDTKKQLAKPSVSFSDVVSIIGEDKEQPTSLMGFNEKKQLEESHDMTVTDLDQKEAFGSESDAVLEPNENVVNEEKGRVNTSPVMAPLDADPSFKISPRPSVVYSSPVVAPLDADPSMPPYDPKKNYLSPRPQFLHYRPNPRIEHYLNKGKQLEEIFISESSSDTEVSELETRSETSEKQQSEEDASRELESATEAGKVLVEDDNEEEEEEEEEIEAESPEQIVSESIEANGISKPRRFRPFKLLRWLLVLAVAYYAVSATFSPPSEFSMLKDSGFYDFYVPPAFTEYAKANYEQLGEKLRMWSESSLAYVKMLISSLGEEEELGRRRFYNLTDLMEDKSFDPLLQPAGVQAIMSEPNHRDKMVERPVEEHEFYQESEKPVKQEIEVQKIFEAVSEEDGEPEETHDIKGKDGGDKNAESVSEKDIDEETHEFREDIEIEMSKLDAEKLERIESADTYKGLQENEVTGDENNFKAVIEQDVNPGTHDVEQKSGEEKDSEDESDAETHEFQQEIEAETAKHDEKKLERIESASIHKDQQITKAIHDNQQEEPGAHIKRSNHSFIYEREQDEMQVTKDQEEIAEIDSSPGTSEAGHDIRPEIESTSEVDDDLEEYRHEVSAKVSEDSEGNLLINQNMLVLSSTVLFLLAISAVLFSKKAKPILPEAAASASASEQTPVNKELNLPPMSVENLIKERLSSLNFQSEVDDTISESYPFDTSSSCQKSGSLYSSKAQKESSEAQSRERKTNRKNSNSSNYRRESLASSASEHSIDSASYGSFTTYEKIPTRSGHVDEEVITPVRRSSRLRNHLSSQ